MTQVERTQSYTQNYSTSICEEELAKEESLRDGDNSNKEGEILENNEEEEQQFPDIEEEEQVPDIDGEEDSIPMSGQEMKPKNEGHGFKLICSDSDNIDENESPEEHDAICIIDETIMSSMSDEESISSLKDSNILDQNMDILDETDLLEDPDEPSSNEPILIDDVRPGTSSKKRSIQNVIQMNDDESSEEAKKFKGEESNESLEVINEKSTPGRQLEVLKMLDECEAKESTLDPFDADQALGNLSSSYLKN